MFVSESSIYISRENYLKGEEISPIRHEYIRGEVFAMAGGTQAHNIIAGNIFALLRNHVRGTGCRAFVENIKVLIDAADVYYYPDVTVSCDERDRNSSDSFIRYPSLVVEVLSDNTEAFDRGDKFADYQQIETLQEYVLIGQKRQKIECFRRNSERRWELYTYQKGEEIYLASVNFRTAISALYEDVAEFS
ncbi:Uma2 family endonuclease [Argonema galeatum]|uniref:Uma2 family endonuclease n=1 Tax=Argonema galeatum TaxID=2942762 RepID=UPI002011ABFC|nr:Uma2 family endonuclease [Argonema galeatum]MCL1464563.1 Uma2 family endonuclease [Argonema galeatum A003/A1]